MRNNQSSTKLEARLNFETYLRKLQEIRKLCPREINYQLELIKPFLENFLEEDIQMIDTSNNSRDTKIHKRKSYTTEYGTAPDLIVGRGYQYANKKSEEPSIYLAVEIKIPDSGEMKSGEIENYDQHIILELATYLSTVDSVILTNCIRWQFFTLGKGREKSLLVNYAEIRPILEKMNKEWWKEEGYKTEPSQQELLEYLKNEHYKKLKSFFDSGQELLIKKEENYMEKSDEYCKELLKKLNTHLEEVIRETIEKLPCKTIDLLPREKSLELIESLFDSEDDRGYSIEESKEWTDLIKYLNEFIKKSIRYTDYVKKED